MLAQRACSQQAVPTHLFPPLPDAAPARRTHARRTMTAERVLFALECLRRMITAAGHRFMAHPTPAVAGGPGGAVAAVAGGDAATSPPAAGVQRSMSGLGGLFDGDSSSPGRCGSWSDIQNGTGQISKMAQRGERWA